MKFKKALKIIENRGFTAYEIHKKTGLNESGIRRVLNKVVEKPQRTTQEAFIRFAIESINTMQYKKEEKKETIQKNLRIRELRKSSNQSQTELAQAIGVSLRTIQNWEAETSDVSTKKLREIAKHYDVTIPYLFGGEETVKNEKLDLIKKISTEHDISAYVIGQNTSISASSAHKILNGDQENPRTKTLNIILDFLEQEIAGSENSYALKNGARNEIPDDANFKNLKIDDKLNELYRMQYDNNIKTEMIANATASLMAAFKVALEKK